MVGTDVLGGKTTTVGVRLTPALVARVRELAHQHQRPFSRELAWLISKGMEHIAATGEDKSA